MVSFGADLSGCNSGEDVEVYHIRNLETIFEWISGPTRPTHFSGFYHSCYASIKHSDSHQDNLYLPDTGSPQWLLLWPICVKHHHYPSHWLSPSFTSYSSDPHIQLMAKSNRLLHHNFLTYALFFPLSWPWHQFRV